MPSPSAADRLWTFQIAGNPPVNCVDFTVLAELDVVGFDVHVNDVFAVRKADGIAELVKDFQIFFDGDLTDLLFPRSSLDVFHGVEKGSFGTAPQFVNRGDIGVFQHRRNFRFVEELL